ncbi:MAG: peptidyl-prolyl cis-trans isomerase [Deltaproteobacteria bacterium]|nr:MAG: peptidyl-prolyl cis-trans isomerase [Deltaproteobacteria bacterium]
MSFCTVAACKNDAPQPAPVPAAKQGVAANPEVVFETSQGKFTVRLFADKAPQNVANLLQYVESGFYKDTIFHRIIPDFMIQGGGFDRSLKQKPTRGPVKNEASPSVSNKRGTVAMARTNDPDSATAQFFINTRDNPNLDRSPGSAGYTVVGEVTEGLATIDLIRNLPTRCPSWTGQACTETIPNGLRDVPIEPVTILGVHKK